MREKKAPTPYIRGVEKTSGNRVQTSAVTLYWNVEFGNVSLIAPPVNTATAALMGIKMAPKRAGTGEGVAVFQAAVPTWNISTMSRSSPFTPTPPTTTIIPPVATPAENEAFISAALCP